MRNNISFTEIKTRISFELDQVIARINDDQLSDFITELQRAKRIFLTGEGRSGLIAKMFAMRLMHLGFHVYVVGETTTPSIQTGDLLVACSGSGETEVTCSYAEKSVKIGANLIVVTANPNSRLSRISHLLIEIPSKHKYNKSSSIESIQFGGSLFEQCMFFIFESIILKIMIDNKIDESTMANRHANLE